MTWGYLPPAASDVFLPAVITRLLRGQDGNLEQEICTFLGASGAAAGSSWVFVLRQLLSEIAKRHPDRREVILPSYSCNEFTKATLLAGLRPRYVDLRHDLASDPIAISTAINSNTLAAFSINNIGRESDNAAVRALCDRNGIICIEDATYTFLGTSDRDGRRFGTYGHFAVLNFSEGKIIPVGGGAVVTNTDVGVAVIDAVRRNIADRPPAGTLRELTSLAVYRAGSSRIGYSAYRLLRAAVGTDLKQRLSMEPTRKQEVGNDLERDDHGNVVLRAERVDLEEQAELRPIGKPKQLCGAEVIRNAARLIEARTARHTALERALSALEVVELFPLPENGMRIKAPFVMKGDLSPKQQEELDRLGVARGYATEYPTYGDAACPSSNRFFERLFTLPVHRHIDAEVIRDIVTAIASVARSEAQ